MPLNTLQMQLICCFVVVLIAYAHLEIFDDDYVILDDDPKTDLGKHFIKQDPGDIHSEIYGYPWFKHETGVCEELFDIMMARMDERISEARNIYGKYTEEENKQRKKRSCNITNENGFICFLQQMRSGKLIWNSAFEHKWNKSSVNVGFFHVLEHFVDEFDAEVIKKMDDDEILSQLGAFEGYPSAYQCLDGSHFIRRRSVELPEGLRRREMYSYKTKAAEGQNVQAVVNAFGLATEVVTGIPAGMPDSMACDYVCEDDWANSTLVDEGYRVGREEFIVCDGSDEHKEARSVVERYFGRLKLMWRMVGNKYCRAARYHSLVIRAAFILTNMVISYEGGLNKRSSNLIMV